MSRIPYGLRAARQLGRKTCHQRFEILTHLSNEKNPGCAGCIGDYTTQLYGDFNKAKNGCL